MAKIYNHRDLRNHLASTVYNSHITKSRHYIWSMRENILRIVTQPTKLIVEEFWDE